MYLSIGKSPVDVAAVVAESARARDGLAAAFERALSVMDEGQLESMVSRHVVYGGSPLARSGGCWLVTGYCSCCGAECGGAEYRTYRDGLAAAARREAAGEAPAPVVCPQCAAEGLGSRRR